MAQILTFRCAEMRRDEGAQHVAPASAEVIVFPGVRYEHWDETGAQSNASRKKRRRDVLELAE